LRCNDSFSFGATDHTSTFTPDMDATHAVPRCLTGSAQDAGKKIANAKREHRK